jgi:hypothetical protein
MGISLKPEHLKCYKDVAWLLVKYGRSDLVKHASLEDILTDRAPISTEVVPEAKFSAIPALPSSFSSQQPVEVLR